MQVTFSATGCKGTTVGSAITLSDGIWHRVRWEDGELMWVLASELTFGDIEVSPVVTATTPATINMTEIVATLNAQGIPAWIETTGGGTATIFAGPVCWDTDKDGEVGGVVAGPGFFDSPNQAYAYSDEFSFARTTSAPERMWCSYISDDDTPASVASAIVALLRDAEEDY